MESPRTSAHPKSNTHLRSSTNKKQSLTSSIPPDGKFFAIPSKKNLDKLLYVAWDNGVLFQISIPDEKGAIDPDLTVIFRSPKKQ